MQDRIRVPYQGSGRGTYAAACACMALVPVFSFLSAVPAALLPVPWCYLAASVLNFIMLAGSCCFLAFRKGCPVGGMCDAMGVFFGVLSMFCFYPGALLVSRAAAGLFPAGADLSGAYVQGSILDFGVPTAWVLAAFLPGICEELLCRGLLYTAFRRHGSIFAAILSAACFASMHGSLQQAMYAFYFGIVLAMLREATGSVVPCIACHAAFNSVGILQQALPVRAPALSASMAGTPLEQWALLAMAVGCGAAGFFVIRKARQYAQPEERDPAVRPGISGWLMPLAAAALNAAYCIAMSRI